MGEVDLSLQSKQIALKCPACGAGFRSMAWTAGMKCPECDSDEIAPAVIIEGAVAYSIANRKKGYAIEDIRFGKIAQWAGFISPYQYNQALAKQKQIADTGREAPHIAQILMSQNIISALQMKAVLNVYDKTRPDTDDREFLAVAVQNKFITQLQADEMIALQREMKKQTTPPPVSVLLFEKRLMNENQILAILRSQHKRAVGPIHEALDVVEQNREPTVIEKYIGRKGDPLRKYKAAAYIAVGILLLLIWGWYYGLIGFRERVPYYCRSCKETWTGKLRSSVPVKCRYCGEKSGYYGFYCEKCRLAYGLTSRTSEKRCTHCQSLLFSQLTPEKMKEAKKRLREEEEADQKGIRKSDFKID